MYVCELVGTPGVCLMTLKLIAVVIPERAIEESGEWSRGTSTLSGIVSIFIVTIYSWITRVIKNK